MPTNISNARASSDLRDPREKIIDIFTDPTGGSGPPSARDDIYNVASDKAKVTAEPLPDVDLFASVMDMLGRRTPRNTLLGPAQNRGSDMGGGARTIDGRTSPYVEGFNFEEQQKKYNDLKNQAAVKEMMPSANYAGLTNENTGGIASLLGRQDGPGTAAFNNPLNRFPPGMLQSNYMADSGDLGKMDKNYMAAENNPMAEYTNPLVNVLAGLQTNPRTGEKFDMTNPDDRYDFYNLTQDTVGKEDALIQQRQLDDDRAQLAAAAQQPQTFDPCPEGYRLDPITRSCVPTDDTTDTTDTTPGIGRVYETMVAPQENYSQVTAPSNIPSINMPDIFTGN